jgi:transcriptional regulator with XRE-family HTH domain
MANKMGAPPRDFAGQLSQEQVGMLLGISKMRVSQIEARALAMLRRRPAMRELAQEFGIDPDQPIEEVDCA